MFLVLAWIIGVALLLAYRRLCAHGGVSPLRQRTLIYYMGALALLLLGTQLASEVLSLMAWDSSATIMHYIAHFWAGAFIFGAVFALPALALGWLLRGKFAKSGKKLGYGTVGALVLIPFLCGAATSGYGIWEGSNVRIMRTTLESPKIPPDEPLIRLAAITDLHLANPVQYGILEDMVENISSQKPHLILALGDIVVGPISNGDRVASLLSKLEAPLGKYFIYGNHELLSGRNQPIGLLSKAGFKPLINEGITVGKINLIGMSDAGMDDFQGGGLPPLINNGLFTVLMEHRPIVSSTNAALFDLQLSGHTHGGQVWPFKLFMAIRYPYINGLYRIAERKWVYTSPGVGTYGPPIRLLCPPEITIIDLVAN
jgi:uncharacterized protein